MNPIQRNFVLAVIAIIPYIGLGIWLSSSLRTDSIRHFHKPSNPASEKKHHSTKELRLLAKELSETQRSLQHSQLLFYRLEKHIQLVKELIISIDGNLTDDLKKDNSVDRSSVNSLPKREVCAEKFMAPSWEYVFPRFRKGFDRVNCSDFVPLDQLVTMIVTSPEEISTENLQNIFKGIVNYYPSVPVMFVSKSKTNLNLKEFGSNITNVVFDDLTHGKTWSMLLKTVSTPYVLFAPDITYFTDDVNVERLIRVLSENKDTIIAGGSHKNQRGEWDKGCFQVNFRNWVAFFLDGYYRSFTDCLVCDVLPGPFMAKTKELKELGFDEKLPFGAFLDIFWRIKLKHPEKVVVSCPDVMFETRVQEIPHEKYVALANKWDVKKWINSDGTIRWYGCRRGGRPNDNTASCRKQSGLLVPSCDLENLADMIKFVMKECENAGLLCELNEGSQLGAVKFQGVLPWELDADIHFPNDNFTAMFGLIPRFKAAGYRVTSERTEKWRNGHKVLGAILLYKNGWKIDLYGHDIFQSAELVASGQKPTKVKFAGMWVNAFRNPGLSMRNRYGPEIYHHVQHSSSGVYKSGVFSKCPTPGHSACLDRLPADGSLQFSDFSIQ